MARRVEFQWGLIFFGIVVIGPVGCRFDSDRSAYLDIEKDNTGGSSGGGVKDDRSGKPNIEPGNKEDDPDTNVSLNTVTGTVRDLITDVPLEGIKVVALSNVDLSELGVETTTGDDGRFALEGIIDKEICVKVVGTEGDDARIDACNCNIPTDQVDRDFVSTQFAVAEAIYGFNRVSSPQTIVMGGVYYKNDTGEEIRLDCVKVEVEPLGPETEIIYFKGGFPDRTQTMGTDISGRFLIVKFLAGHIHLNAFMNGEKIGSVSAPICDVKDATGGMYITNHIRIHVDKPDDPTPDCETEW